MMRYHGTAGPGFSRRRYVLAISCDFRLIADGDVISFLYPRHVRCRGWLWFSSV